VPDKQAVKTVLFLCTGNSARSQMAEGFLRKYGKERFEVYSAGISPVGINPHAVKVMKELGIDISGQTSDAINKEMIDKTELLITLCGDARENCPFVPVKVKKRHWALEDPARAEGNSEEIIAKFREIRDQISNYVRDLITE
jgi:arsenate reductase (thioredoxin)